MKRMILFFIFVKLCDLIVAQSISSFRDNISKENLEKHVNFLCDPGLSGRKFSTAGERKVAGYLQEQFARSGLAGNFGNCANYCQDFALNYDSLLSFNIYNDRARMEYLSDFFSFEFCFLTDVSAVELVYAGFGLDREDYSDYKDLNVKNKWVAVEINSPVDSSGKLTDQFDFNSPVKLSEMDEKKQTAQKHGASGIIFKVNSRKYLPEVLSHVIPGRSTYGTKESVAFNLAYGTFPGIIAKSGKIDSLMGVNTTDFNARVNSMLRNKQSPAGIAGADVTFNLKTKKIKFSSQNVIGVIKGKNEKAGIIISAHYDAVKDNDSLFYPGANDNAAGTAAVLQLSEVFSKISEAGYVPERSIAFVLFSGEEEGIVGSTSFVKNIPFETDSSTVNINLDCVGILDTVNNKNGRASISAPENIINRYKEIFKDLNAKEVQPLELNFDNFYQYSDNASFSYEGYQAMHISTGGGEYIHSPQDRAELINYWNLVNVTRLIFDFACFLDPFTGK
jgi:hypothetical protein